MTSRLTPYQLRDLNQRAGSMLERALARKRPGSVATSLAVQRDAAERIITDYGRRGVHHVIRCWLDSALAVTPGADAARGQRCEPAYVAEDNDDFEPSRVQQLVGELLVGRLSDDHVRVYRLLDKIPMDDTGPILVVGIANAIADHMNLCTKPGPARGGVVKVTSPG